MKTTLKNLSRASRRAERRADALLAKLVNFPFSWIPALAVIVLAVYGAINLVI